MESKKRRELPEFETIQAAIKVTLKQSIIYFPFSAIYQQRVQKKYEDEFGRIYYVPDEYMKRRLETKLITKILNFEIRL